MFEYTPGIPALATVSGKGESHRSGIHSLAVGPQIAGSQLRALIPTMTVVFSGMKTAVSSLALMGPMGRIVSFCVLWVDEFRDKGPPLAMVIQNRTQSGARSEHLKEGGMSTYHTS